VNLELRYVSYRAKLVVSFTSTLLLLSILAQVLYKDFLRSIALLVFNEEYSYLFSSLFTVLAVLYLSLRYTGLSYGVRPSKVVLSVAFALLATVLHYIASIDPEYMVQLMGFSFSLVFIGVTLMIYELSSLAEVLPLLSPLLLIPVPTSFVDSLTPYLSKAVARIVAFLTGARIIASPGFTELEVSTPGGIARFNVEAICTGIVAIGAVLAIAPLLLYVASFSIGKLLRRVGVALLVAVSALAVGFVGCIIRVLIVVLAAKSIGVDHAYQLLHYSPSILYSSIAVIIAYHIINRFCRFRQVMPQATGRVFATVSWGYVAGAQLVVAIIVFSVIGLSQLICSPSPEAIPEKVVHVSSLESFVKDPEIYVLNVSNAKVYKYFDEYLTRVLNALAVYRALITVGNETLSGYIEVVDTPARLHTLQLCLTLQGYNVVSTWSGIVGSAKTVYMALEKSGWRGVLAYTVLPVEVVYGDSSVRMFVRVSLMSGGDMAKAVDAVTKALSGVAGSGHYQGLPQSVRYFVWISTALILALVAYAITLAVLGRVKGVE